MKTTIALIAALTLSCNALAQPAAKPAPKPAAATPAAKPGAKPAAAGQAAPARIAGVEGITEYRLANGLKVLLFPDVSRPTITVNVTYLVGSRHENYGETGMAHLLEHLLFKGTPSNADIPKQFNQRGARFNGTTNYDRTNYFELFPASEDNLKWAIELEADRMVNSNIAQKDLDSEMTVVRNEYERGENNPGQVMQKRMHSVAYDWHNYQNSPIGNRSDIENVKIENLQAFYRRYYQPDNAVVLVAGKFDEAKALALVNETFGRIPKPARVLPALWTVEPVQDGERSFTVRRSGNIQLVMAGYKVPGTLHPDSAALSYLGTVLANAPQGRLHKALVDTGKAVSVSGGGGNTVDPGLLVLSAVVKEGDPVEPVRDILVSIVEEFHKSPPTEAEMTRARLAFEKQLEQFLSSPETMAISMSEAIARGDWRLAFLSRDMVKKTTSADVERVARAYFKRDNRTVGLFLPTANADRAEIPASPTPAEALKDFKVTQTMVAGEDFDPSPANIDARTERYTLANGAKVALLPKKTRGETVNVVVTGHNTSLETIRGRTTALSMASALAGRGTKKYSRSELQDEMNKLKVSGNAGVSGTTFRTTRPNLAKALELMAHVMRDPAFEEKEFTQLRTAATAGINAGRSEPGQLANEALARHFDRYPKGDPRHAMSREEQLADLSALTLDDIRAAHRDFGGLTNAEIAVVGDFDPAEVKPVLAELFGNWKSIKAYERIPLPYAEVAAINRTIETPDKENAVFRAQMLLQLRQDNPEFAQLFLANYMFGGGAGLNARVAKRIRGKEGLSYGASTSMSASDFEQRGVFSASATAAPQNIAKLETIFREELDLALKDGFTAEELANAKSGLLAQRAQTRAQDAYLATSWADRMHRGKTFEETAEFDRAIQAATLEQVNAAFRKHIVPEKLTIVKAGDFAKAAKSDSATK